MAARYVKSKKSEDIIEALLDVWVAKFGSFSKSIHDNGGEFVSRAFDEMVDLLGIQDGTSGGILHGLVGLLKYTTMQSTEL